MPRSRAWAGGEAGLALVAGRSSSGGLEAMLARGLRRAGYRVAALGYEDFCGRPGLAGGVALRRLLVSPLRERLLAASPCLRAYNRAVARAVERLGPDLVLVVKGEALSRATLRLLRRHGAPCLAYLNPDEPRYMSLTLLYREEGFTLFTPCRPCLLFLRRRGARVFFLPFAADIDPAAEWPGCGVRLRAVALLGTMYPARLRAVRRLLRGGVPVVVAGPGWRLLVPGAGHGLYGRRYVAAIRAAYASLNVHHPSDRGYKANMRVFEIPGAGGVELTDNPGEVLAFYTRGEVYTYRGTGELLEAAREILEEPRENLCEKARRAYEKTRRLHTYSHRARYVASACSL